MYEVYSDQSSIFPSPIGQSIAGVMSVGPFHLIVSNAAISLLHSYTALCPLFAFLKN